MPHTLPAELTVTRLRRATGQLATEALRRMEEGQSWYRAMSAEDRSWVGLVAQAAVAAFIAWYRSPDGSVQITADVFGTAPRELTRAVSLHQTLEMTRTMVDVVEEHVEELAAPEDVQHLREAVLRYSRDVAFAAAEVYARAAETRGAWDARLEALVVDSLVRGEVDGLGSRAAALGWTDAEQVAVVAGSTPPGHVDDLVAGVRRQARGLDGDALVGVHGERLVVVIGHAEDPLRAAAELVVRFGAGPVVTGPVVAGLTEAVHSARAALTGLSAAPAWPAAPRPVAADDLLPERLLGGDRNAGRLLVERGYRRLANGGQAPLLETAATYLDLGRSLESAARALFVHPNTVRYRLRRVADITGWDPADPRDGFVLQVAITAGRLAEAGGPDPFAAPL